MNVELTYEEYVKSERKRLVKIRTEAVRGFPQDVLDAIALLKNRNIIPMTYDPIKHFLTWRAFGEGVKRSSMLELCDFQDDEEEPKVSQHTLDGIKAHELVLGRS